MMTMMIYAIALGYIFDATHKRTPYFIKTLNKWVNRGELIEILVKVAHGFAPAKDGNGSWRTVDDIPELNASVKSECFSLTQEYLGDNVNDIVTTYLENVHAKTFLYVILDEETQTLAEYRMDAEMFGRFLRKFGKYRPSDKKLRGSTDSQALRCWLKANAHG